MPALSILDYMYVSLMCSEGHLKQVLKSQAVKVRGNYLYSSDEI